MTFNEKEVRQERENQGARDYIWKQHYLALEFKKIREKEKEEDEKKKKKNTSA